MSVIYPAQVNHAPVCCEAYLTGGKNSVLIVDDDETIARTFTRILKKNGYITNNAKSAEQALTQLRENSYDVTLIDIRLPDGNGIDLLTKMPEKNRNTVKIIITGSPAKQNRCDAAENGADAYLEKPIKPEHLLSVIAENLKLKKQRMN